MSRVHVAVEKNTNIVAVNKYRRNKKAPRKIVRGVRFLANKIFLLQIKVHLLGHTVQQLQLKSVRSRRRLRLLKVSSQPLRLDLKSHLGQCYDRRRKAMQSSDRSVRHLFLQGLPHTDVVCQPDFRRLPSLLCMHQHRGRHKGLSAQVPGYPICRCRCRFLKEIICCAVVQWYASYNSTIGYHGLIFFQFSF